MVPLFSLAWIITTPQHMPVISLFLWGKVPLLGLRWVKYSLTRAPPRWTMVRRRLALSTR